MPIARPFGAALLLIVGLQACGPLPEPSVTSAPTGTISSAPTGTISDASHEPTPGADACGDGSISVVDEAGAGRDAIAQDLAPQVPLGMPAEEMRDRWNRVAPSDGKLAGFEPTYLTGGEERNLQGEIGSAAGDAPVMILLAPLDKSGRIRSVAIRWRRPSAALDMEARSKISAGLASLVEVTAASDRPLGVSACVLRRLGSWEENTSRVARIRGEPIAYRVLEVDSIVWFTATRSRR